MVMRALTDGLIHLYEWSLPGELIATGQHGIMTCEKWMELEAERIGHDPRRTVRILLKRDVDAEFPRSTAIGLFVSPHPDCR